MEATVGIVTVIWLPRPAMGHVSLNKVAVDSSFFGMGRQTSKKKCVKYKNVILCIFDFEESQLFNALA